MPRLNSRAKGRRYERRIGKRLAEWWQVDPAKWFRPTPLSGGWSKDHAAGDLVVPPSFPWVVECKHREDWNWSDLVEANRSKATPLGWWDQAIAACGDGARRPLVIFTRNRWPDYVLLSPDELPAMGLEPAADFPRLDLSVVRFSELVAVPSRLMRVTLCETVSA